MQLKPAGHLNSTLDVNPRPIAVYCTFSSISQHFSVEMLKDSFVFAGFGFSTAAGHGPKIAMRRSLSSVLHVHLRLVSPQPSHDTLN